LVFLSPKLSSFVEKPKIWFKNLLVWHNQLIEFDAHLTLHVIRKESHLTIKFTFFIKLLWLFLLYILQFYLILLIFLLLSHSIIFLLMYSHLFCKHSSKHILRTTTLANLLRTSHLFENVILILFIFILSFIFFIFVILLIIVHFINS